MVRKLKLIPILLAATAGAIALFSMSGASAATTCPPFTVLHNDRIGSMSVPAGQYTITPKNLSCSSASQLFTRFLSDYDGILPGGWYTVSGPPKGFATTASNQSFTIKPGAVKPSGGTTTNGNCPGTFAVLHNDRVGSLYLPRGNYQIATKGLQCWFDTQKFAYFLNYDSAGKLPSPWKLNVGRQAFNRSPNHYFSVKYLNNKSGGGTYPYDAVTCANTYKVTKAATIEGVPFPVGSYYLNAFSTYSCDAAAKSFKQFLAAGAIPPAWAIEPQTASFISGNSGFEVEPVLK